MKQANEYFDQVCSDITEYIIDKDNIHVSVFSKNKIKVICPCCGKEHFVSIRTLVKRHNTYCEKCSDNYSYPERFMAAVLDSLDVDFVSQFTDVWTEKYKYDFMFIHNCQKYIVETDGDLGHGGKIRGNRITQEESIYIDQYKDKIAINNGYYIIRIDCRYGNNDRFNKMRTSIENSQIKDIFDLSMVNWEECNKKALSSRYHCVINLYKKGIVFVDEIAPLVHLCNTSVKNILHDAMRNNIIKSETIYNTNLLKAIDQPVISNKKYWNGKMTQVYCFEDALVFGTTQDADDYYGFSRYSVRNSLNGYNGYCNGKHFIKYNDLPTDFEFKPYFFPDNQYREHAYCQWSLDGNLENIFLKKSDIPEQYKYLSIQRVINGTFKTAYGYFWSILPKQLEYQFKSEMDVYERPFLLQKYEKNLKGEKYYGY